MDFLRGSPENVKLLANCYDRKASHEEGMNLLERQKGSPPRERSKVIPDIGGALRDERGELTIFGAINYCEEKLVQYSKQSQKKTAGSFGFLRDADLTETKISLAKQLIVNMKENATKEGIQELIQQELKKPDGMNGEYQKALKTCLDCITNFDSPQKDVRAKFKVK